MKNLNVVLFFLFFTSINFAQQATKVEGNTVTGKEQAPIWPGCENSEQSPKNCFNTEMNLLIKKNFKFPKDAKGNLVRGKSTLSFYIDEKGAAGKITAEGPHKALNEEAIRMVKLFPKMTPGKRNGKNAPIKYIMPLNF